MSARPLFLLALLLLSCSNETKITKPPSLPPPPPPGVIQRFVASWEQKKTQEYADLFTTDFTFEFSATRDPDLATKYSTGWFKSDETEAARHLFQGWTPSGQPYAPAASSINIDLATMNAVDDNASGVDPRTHRYLATRVDGQIVIPPTPPETDPTIFRIENNYVVLYLVRGDEASLQSTQSADSTHWYVYRWVDLTSEPAVGPTRVSTRSTPPPTWSRLRAMYR